MSEKQKVLVSPLLAVSTLNQANLIKKLILSLGYDCEFKSTITIHDINRKDTYAVLWFQLALVEFLNDAVFPYIYCNKPKAIYVTIEGIPKKPNVIASNLPRLEYIANSEFTANCLKMVGMKVIDVVHHGVDMDLANKAVQSCSLLRQKLMNQFKDRCKILYVGRNDPRKGLPKLAKAVGILNDTRPDDFVLILVTEESAKNLFPKKNVVFYAPFGSLDYFKVLQLMASVDYLVFPTLCEGFGLPVLEANSVGTPAIHTWCPPLTEFSSKEFNFVYDYVEEKTVSAGASQWWLFHDYPPEFLAEMMDYAIDVFKNDKKQYAEYCMKAMEHAEKWDYRKVYRRLLKHINIEVS